MDRPPVDHSGPMPEAQEREPSRRKVDRKLTEEARGPSLWPPTDWLAKTLHELDRESG